ncbi:GNAT family N-acetyltransferase [Antribacter gilvus]|uniref:GNAT family N-acetyltransferase n=1 Tax=Antribacter gilvus TaxID=2304675 RepID=UPI001F0C2DD0|nr:GNAT family N-acetyltransferase [Antribacter gilvus]
MQTDRLILRRVTPADAAAFLTWRARPEVVTYMYQPTWTEAVARQKLATWAEAPFEQPGDALVLAVERQSEPGVIGEALLKWAPGARQAEVGWALHPDVRGEGYATEAARALLDLAFGTYRFHRAFARIDEENTASVRVCERLGMRLEARLVENDLRDGVWATEVDFAILAREHGAPLS